MRSFSDNFLFGAATAAHQVEGNNVNSDYWTMEQLTHSNFSEPSLNAVDHYHHYKEDIALLASVGLNAYRFSIEWARIEPEEGIFDRNVVVHYREVLECCHAYHITPVVTLHHFSSPKWLIEKGGWEWEGLEQAFPRYCKYIVQELGDLMEYVCTINEANMGIQIASVAKSMMLRMGITPQVGMNFDQIIATYMPKERQLQRIETAAAFGLSDPNDVHDFLSMRTEQGDVLTMRVHCLARDAMKESCPHLKIGLTLSLYDLQPQPDGEKIAQQEWFEHFGHYLPYVHEDDFIGVQNYTRKTIGEAGDLGNPEGVELTQMGYEFYPQGIANVVRRVSRELPDKEILVTENGISSNDDSRRIAFIQQAIEGLADCVADGIPLSGYFYWSLLDNFEWQKGFDITFGLIAVDRATQKRYPKDSLYEFGKIARVIKG